ncbi:MAG: 16S rRNA (cytidine(1402)-2'-O)-methyltransferase, partial [Flavobacteriales bacterium]
VLYESPHRLVKSLEQMITFCGPERACSVSREISKKFEETVRGTLQEVHHHFTTHDIKGEFVIVVAPMGNSKTEE